MRSARGRVHVTAHPHMRLEHIHDGATQQHCLLPHEMCLIQLRLIQAPDAAACCTP